MPNNATFCFCFDWVMARHGMTLHCAVQSRAAIFERFSNIVKENLTDLLSSMKSNFFGFEQSFHHD